MSSAMGVVKNGATKFQPILRETFPVTKRFLHFSNKNKYFHCTWCSFWRNWLLLPSSITAHNFV